MQTVYVVDGVRSPFLKARDVQGPFSASDLAVKVGRQLLLKQPFEASDLDEVIIGNTMPSPDEANIGRIIALRLGCGEKVPGWTVHRNCASGLQALDSAYKDIQLGRADLVLAGGTDAMSRAPVLYNKKMTNWLGRLMSAKTFGMRLSRIAKFRPNMLTPVIGLERGLTDPVVCQSMGQTAENIAYRFNIDRDAMDDFALASHERSRNAFSEGRMNEITPIIDEKGKVYEKDDGVREADQLKKIGKLKPYFDKPFGTVTPGNSSQITDGAALLLLASEKAVKKYGLKPKAKIVDSEWAALDPTQMGLGPVHAATPILQRQSLGLDDVDYVEINEAFAAQVLACQAAWQDEDYCVNELGLKHAMGTLSPDRLNVDGGAVAVGHPIGASGARIVLHLMQTLQQKQAKRGLASICIGGGQGGAWLIERVS